MHEKRRRGRDSREFPQFIFISDNAAYPLIILKPDMEIDCIGLYCPEPIFRTRTALDELEKGQILKVISDDPSAEEDIKRLVKRLNHELLEITRNGEEVTIYIRK